MRHCNNNVYMVGPLLINLCLYDELWFKHDGVHKQEV